MPWGLCTYPHGGWATFGLLVLCIGAVTTTTYAVMSCHFVIVEFISVNGDFGEMFNGIRTSGESEKHKMGAGLFTWLKPNDSQSDWNDGQCIGYTERQRDVLSDGVFETSRFFSVFVVLFGILVLIWGFFLACMSMRRWQLYLLRGMMLLLTIMTCLVFLIKRSALCHDIQMDTTCSLDAGGLVNIAGAILWFASFLLTTFCMSLSNSTPRILSRTSSSGDEQRRRRRKRRAAEKEGDKLEKLELSEEGRAVAAAEAEAAAKSESASTPDTKISQDILIECGEEPEVFEQEGSIEVNVGSFLDKIESLVDEE